MDFAATFGFSLDSYAGGGSNPVEPEPADGYQEWQVNWYNAYSETVIGVQLQAAGSSYFDTGSGGSWSFSTTFDTPGTYVIDLTGGWTTRADSYTSTESATRNCYNYDPEGGGSLTCDSWQWNYYDNTDSYDYDSGFNSLSLTVQVAAVPEPQTYAMLLAGLVAVGCVARRRRS